MSIPHRLIPGSKDHNGRKWCAACGLPENNKIHRAPVVEDQEPEDEERHPWRRGGQ